VAREWRLWEGGAWLVSAQEPVADRHEKRRDASPALLLCIQKAFVSEQLFLEVENHVVGHALQVVLGVPAPLGAGAAVVHLVGPAVGDGLFDGFGFVDHFESGVAFLDGGIDNLGVKAHGGDVEAVAVDELGGVGFHDVNHGLLGVGHVHHVHVSAFLEGADEFLAFDGGIVDFDGVVGGAAAGEGLIADEAGETDAAGVDTEAGEIVVGEQLAGHLGDAVDGVGALDSVLRGVVVGSAGAEGANGAGGEDGAAEKAGHLKAVDEAADAHIPAEHGVELGGGAEDGGEVVDGVDVVLLYSSGYLHDLGRVDALHGATLVGVALEGTEVAADNVVVTINVSQITGQLGTNLSAGTNYKYSLHCGIVLDTCCLLQYSNNCFIAKLLGKNAASV